MNLIGTAIPRRTQTNAGGLNRRKIEEKLKKRKKSELETTLNKQIDPIADGSNEQDTERVHHPFR